MTQTVPHKDARFGLNVSALAGLSIRTKLALIVALGFLTTFVVAFYLMTAKIQTLGLGTQTKNETMVAEMLIGQMQAPGKFKDGARLAEIYAPAVDNDPALQWIEISHATGEVLSAFEGRARPPKELQNLIEEARTTQASVRLFMGDLHLLASPITARDGSGLIGVAGFTWDANIVLAAQKKQVREALMISALVALAGLAAIVFAVSRLVTAPIAKLNAAMADVTSEVRALAQRASDSATEIKDLTLRSTEHVTDGSALPNQARSALSEIIEGVNHLSDLVELIAKGSSEQVKNLSEIKESVAELDGVTQQNATVIEESSAASRSLSHEAERMTEALKQFPLDREDGRRPVSTGLSGPGTWAEDIADTKARKAQQGHAPAMVIQARPTRGAQAAVNAVEDGWEEF